MSLSTSEEVFNDFCLDLSDCINAHEQELSKEDWYWGSVTKSKTEELFHGLKDGYFVVRKTTIDKKVHYTLSLRYKGNTKHFRILQNGDKYGWSEPCEFSSIYDLVTFYRGKIMERWFPGNEIVYTRPLIKSGGIRLSLDKEYLKQYSDNSLIEALKTKTIEAVKSMEAITFLSDKKRELLQKCDEIKLTKKQVLIFQKWIQDQSVHMMNIMNSFPNFKNHSIEQFRKLNIKLNTTHCAIETLTKKEECALKDFNELEEKIVDENEKHLDFLKSRKRIYEELESRGLSDIDIKENGDYFDNLKLRISVINPINDSSQWLKNISKTRAESLLRDKPVGTFLIRPSSKIPNAFALDIVNVGGIDRCHIYSEEGRYGFSKNKLLFNSLSELVNTYHYQDLSEYNKNWKTKLIYPIDGVGGNVTR